jgi:hypothetical protein
MVAIDDAYGSKYAGYGARFVNATVSRAQSRRR